jgi:RNA polymerase sigma-70 factor (ECF subfamily)
MSGPGQPGSSTLLLLRLTLSPHDAEAWDQFVKRYSGVIYQWCLRYRLQDADARDITQTVFATLLGRLQTFDRSRARFRTWLFRVVANCVSDWCREPAHRLEKGTEAARQLLASAPARRELKARLNEEFDLEMLEVAESTVRLQVAAHCWQAYQLRCKEGLSLQDAAGRLGIPAGHVSKYALRVREQVARQISHLEGLCGPARGQPGGSPHDDLPAASEMA